MNFRRYILLFVALVCCSAFLRAQNSEDLLDFYKQRNSEFQNWRTQANAEFTDYLAAAWEEFMVNRGKEDPIGRVPETPVYFDPKDYEGFELLSVPCNPAFDFSFIPALTPVVESPAITASYTGGSNVTIDFFGIEEQLPFVENMRLPRILANEQEVSKGWKVLSESDYLQVVDALTVMQKKYALSDWALYTAIKKYTDAVYIQEYINEKVLTQMFLLSQMQYKARVGSSGQELILLLPFEDSIYQISYITDKDEDFYIFSYSRLNSQDPLYTFSKDFSAAEKKFNLVIDKQIVVEKSHYRLKSYPDWTKYVGDEFRVPLNIPCVKFTLDYPQSDLLVYHKSAVDSVLRKAVFTQVKYKILKDGMSPQEAVAFVLNLVQKGFDYKTDYEMFGRAKPLFIEESFYYGANNCKDRVLIFSWIVKDLLGLDVVMFGYKGHVACGVCFNGQVAGDSFSYQGREYVMCDPTYIGAPIGATMPKYRGVAPQIVKL